MTGTTKRGPAHAAPEQPHPGHSWWREPLLVALAGVVAGLVTVWLHHPRAGLVAVAVAVLAAAVMRLLFTPRGAGLLVVRSRSLDVAATGLLGSALLVLALAVPFPPA